MRAESYEHAPQVDSATKQESKPGKKVHFFSRRSLITTSAAAAASVAVGTAIGTRLNPPQPSPQAQTDWEKTPLVSGRGTPTAWYAVTNVSQLGDQAMRFIIRGVVGYLIRTSEQYQKETGDTADFIAFSAACTHMGCIIEWQDKDRQFYCPCHGGMFTEAGQSSPHSPVRYAALPRLKVRVARDGTILVEGPADKQ